MLMFNNSVNGPDQEKTTHSHHDSHQNNGARRFINHVAQPNIDKQLILIFPMIVILLRSYQTAQKNILRPFT